MTEALNKKVLLLFPPSINTIEPFKSAPKDQYGIASGFPLGIGYVGAYLRELGQYEVKIVDALKQEMTIDDVIEVIDDYDPRYVGITVDTLSSKTAVALAKEIKNKWGDDKLVIAGGPHASDDCDNLLTRYPFFDYLVIGEGEQTALELLQALDRNAENELKDIEGLAFTDKKTGEIVKTPGRKLDRDLDTYPAPARDLVDMNEYIHRETVLPYAVEVMSSRGCTHRCVFCSFQRKWRPRSSEDIIKEVKGLIKEYPRIRSFAFLDDAFSVSKERVINFCKALIDAGLENYMWSCSCRVDQVDQEMIDWMKKAGCHKILYGLESADPQILKNLNKRIDPETAMRVIDMTTKAGIDIFVTLIVGNPGETHETLNTTYKFIKKLNCPAITWRVMNVYPGTALSKMQHHDDYVSYIYEPEVDDPSVYIAANIVAYEQNPGLDREEQKRLCMVLTRKSVLYKMLTHPGYVIKKAYRMPRLAVRTFLRIFRLTK
ncbi:hypothetical protein BVX97_01825 [bacterium E08(2017)]|nr:hypothetical protein BVX97_01825 [bacterium E08(2017)]